jgi:ATP-dependent Clp protease protease subunit
MKPLIIMAALFTATCANGKSFSTQGSSRTIEIIGDIRGDIVRKADKIHKMALESNEPIYMLLNSPGGMVLPGMVFVDAMKAAQARGVRFICLSNVMAASMAFIIYSECDERYARKNTRLLFHPMSMSTSGSRLQELATDLTQAVQEERRVEDRLRKIMKLKWRQFHPHYFAETFWQAEQLLKYTGESNRFLTVINNVDGFEKNLLNYTRPRGFFMINGFVQKIIDRFEGR